MASSRTGRPFPSTHAEPAAPQAPGAQPSQREKLDSAQLLRGRRMVEICHNGELYRLQATRLGKLILTK